MALGNDNRGQIGELAKQLAERLARGESLAKLTSENSRVFTPLYKAMICAGLRSGRLATALEGLSRSSQRMLEMRRSVYAAVLYPLAVLIIAYALFLFALWTLTPGIIESYAGLEVPRTRIVDLMAALHDTMSYWAPWPPILLAAWILWEIWSLRRLPKYGLWSPLYLVQRWSRRATFADMLALMLEHDVALHEAVNLAAAASNDPGLIAAGREFTEQVQQGSPQVAAGFPPMLRFILTAPQPQDQFVRALRRTAQEYERRAQRTVDWLVLYLPALLTVVVGGGAVLLQTASFLGPWFYLLEQLGRPQ